MRCLLCRRHSHGSLCSKHLLLYTYDDEQLWYRKKKRLSRGVRRREDAKKYHKSETKLFEILRLIFGKDNIVAGVHPIWAVSNKGALLEYDIGIVDQKLLVEYNGLQHYEFPNYFHKTKKQFLAQKFRDRIKKEMAEQHGYNFIVVKYDEYLDYGHIFDKFKELT